MPLVFRLSMKKNIDLGSNLKKVIFSKNVTFDESAKLKEEYHDYFRIGRAWDNNNWSKTNVNKIDNYLQMIDEEDVWIKVLQQ